MKKIAGIFGNAAEWIEAQCFKASYGAYPEELTSRDIALRDAFHALGKIPDKKSPVGEDTSHIQTRDIVAIYNKKQKASAEMAANETFGTIGAILTAIPIYFSAGSDWQKGVWVIFGGAFLGSLKYMHASYSSYKEAKQQLNEETQKLLFPEELSLE